MYVYKTEGDKTARMRIPRKWHALNRETCDRMLAEALGRSR
jgi:hypothetical protein